MEKSLNLVLMIEGHIRRAVCRLTMLTLIFIKYAFVHPDTPACRLVLQSKIYFHNCIPLLITIYSILPSGRLLLWFFILIFASYSSSNICYISSKINTNKFQLTLSKIHHNITLFALKYFKWEIILLIKAPSFKISHKII